MNDKKGKLISKIGSGKLESQYAGIWKAKCHRMFAFLAAPMWLLVTPVYASTTVRVDWGNPTAIAVFKPGDKVRIQSRLITTDTTVPETIENETLLMQLSSPGSFASASTLTDVSLTSQIDSVPPDPNGSPVLTAYISGFDGDEYADVTITVNPVEPLKKSAEQIQHWEDLAHAFHRGELNAELSGELCPPIKGCEEAFAGLAAVYAAQAINYEQLANDPPDPNYTVIALPVTPLAPTVTPDPDVPLSITNAFNALFDNQKQAIGLEQAILTSINRASGAMAANDTVWQQRQTQAAASYLLQLSDLANKQADLQAALQSAWTGAGFPAVVASAAAIHNLQQQLYSNGFSTNEVQLLRQLGLSPDNIAYLSRVLVAQDYNEAALAGAFPANLTYQPFVDALHNAASSLTDLVISNGTPLADGQMVLGEGMISLPGNDFLQFEFNAKVDPHSSSGATLKGRLEIRDMGSQFAIHDSTITGAFLIGNLIVLDGHYQASDHSSGNFRVIATDNSKDGRGSDSFDVTLSNGFHGSGALTQGNVRIIDTASKDDDNRNADHR